MRSRPLSLVTLIACSLVLLSGADAAALPGKGVQTMPHAQPAPAAQPAAQPAAVPSVQPAGARPGMVPVDQLPKVEAIGTVPEQNRAIYLGYKGHIDTDLKFADFFGADHTITAWYMPQYPHANTGPIVAENGGGTYAFGQDDYRLGDGDNGDAGSPVFYVQVGSKKVIYLLPEMTPGKWIHVAVVRKGDTFSLFVWGVKRTPIMVTSKAANTTSNVAELKVSGNAGMPTGTLRFGRRTDGATGANAVWQAYGLVDDIAVFDKALNGTEITSVIAKHRLRGHEANLVAGWSFEKPDANKQLPSKLARPWTQSSRAYHMPVSADRQSSSDKGVFDNPFVIGEVSTEVRLPFKKNEVWSVIQGQDDPSSSHNGYAAFCYDFMLAGQPQTGTYPKGTAMAPVFAAATGKVDAYRKDGAFDGPREPYFMRIRVGEAEHVGYLHLKGDTITSKAHGGSCDADHNCEVSLGSAETINMGDPVAKQGPKAAHLHFSGSGSVGESMTIPIAFSNYWASDDQGATWVKVLRGHPRQGQWIKRTE